MTSEVFAPNEKKPIVTIDGEWNGVMYAKYATGVSKPCIQGCMSIQ